MLRETSMERRNRKLEEARAWQKKVEQIRLAGVCNSGQEVLADLLTNTNKISRLSCRKSSANLQCFLNMPFSIRVILQTLKEVFKNPGVLNIDEAREEVRRKEEKVRLGLATEEEIKTLKLQQKLLGDRTIWDDLKEYFETKKE